MNRAFGYGLKGQSRRSPSRKIARPILWLLLAAAVLTGGYRAYVRYAKGSGGAGFVERDCRLEPQHWAYDQGYAPERVAATPWLSPEEAVNAIVAHHEQKPFFDGRPGDYRLVFVDLDFDGVMEVLIVATVGKTPVSSYTAYRIDGITRKLVAFPRTGDRTEAPDYDWRPNALRLVMDKRTGRKWYSVWRTFGNPSDPQAFDMTLGHVTLKDRAVHTVDVARIGCSREGTSGPYRHSYGFMGKDVTEDRYCEAMREFCSGYYDLHLKVGGLSRNDVAWLDPQLLRKRLLEEYLAFGYDGWEK